MIQVTVETDKSVPVETTEDVVQVDVGEVIKYEVGLRPYLSLERLRSYCYKVTFDELPRDLGYDIVTPAGCSSFVSDGKLYRNLDWGYSETATFRVICKGFSGTAFLDTLRDSHLDDNLIGQLPYHIADGRNDYGIMISTHVLFNDWEWKGTGDIPLYNIPYLVLSRIKTLEDFPAQMAEILQNVKSVPALDADEYLLQFLVTDGTTTYAIMPPESASGSYVAVDITENPKLTNFRWVNSQTVSRGSLQDRPTGVERWNMIPCDLEDLRFTVAYEEPSRLSEFIGINGTTKDSTDAELTTIYNKARAIYLDRKRDGKTWQTMHSVVYSDKGVEEFYVQENFKENLCNK